MKLFLKLSKFGLLFIFVFLFQSNFCVAQENSADDNFKVSYEEEADKTTVLLKPIELPKNKESFSVGALFEYKGEKLEKEPCCAVFFMTSLSKKGFHFKESHQLIIWADKEKMDFGEINWRESAGGTAFILSGAIYPEEMFVGMERDKFLKIARANQVKVQIGNFKFSLSAEQREGLKELSEKMIPKK